MLKKFLSGLFIFLLVFAANLQIVRAQTDTGAALERNRVERIKTNIYRLEDTGKTKVVIRLKSGAKVEGYITKINEDTFEVSNYKIRKTRSIAYRDVARVEPQGGASTGRRIALIVGGLATLIVLVLTLPRNGSTICPLGCRSY